MEYPVGDGSAGTEQKTPSNRRMALIRWLTLGLVIGVILVIFLLRDHVQELAHFGYLGVFFAAMMSNATVFLPLPGVAVVFALGAVFNPFLTALFAGLGAAVGELSGYLLGFSGQGLVEHAGWYQKIRDWMTTHPKLIDLGVLAMAAIPNPFFDAAGIAAGTMKIPIWRFLFFCGIGSIIKMLFFAFGGNAILNMFFPDLKL
jgi:uncharacterized membrane protein YdjX (TVP38/TMEM64 family)